MPKQTRINKKREHASGDTARPESPALEGREPMAEELTGRASATDEDVGTLFGNNKSDHLADGFRGGSNNDPDSDLLKDEDTDSTDEEDVTR